MAYRLHGLELSAGDQRKPEFLKINPNGKIPVVIDEAGGVTIAESGVILVYLAETSGMLLPQAGTARFEVLQWFFFQVGGVGPNSGQFHHFRRHEPRDDDAPARFGDEILRFLRVMDAALSTARSSPGSVRPIASIALVP